MNHTLTAIPFDGLNTDSLGNYLAGLGFLNATAQHFPRIRGCWKDGRFVMLVENEINVGELTSVLLKSWKPTPYDRWWTSAQKADTKAKSSTNIWRERSQRSAFEVGILDAHIVGAGRNRFNPVFGTGGNIGKRDLAKACRDALKLLSKSESPDWLEATLTGRTSIAMPDLNNGGTWFVFANKTFNSGQDWYREGQLSPWSLLLAMEGAFLLAGGVNRRLGSRARPFAVFPFISEPSQPKTDGEIGMARAEFWAPLWKYPATIVEVRALFQRGLAKLGGRAAQAPHEFAVAALDAGVDAGICEFARYELRQTTSSQVFEAIPRERITVLPHSKGKPGGSVSEHRVSDLLMPLIESGWLDRLPRDKKQPRQFYGLRGPIESAIIRIGELPHDPERWQTLLLRLASAQGKIDRNKTHRERCIPIPPLHPDWFRMAWLTPTPETEIAHAIASLGWPSKSTSVLPLIANVFGVEPRRFGKFGPWSLRFPKTRTAQAVWGPGHPLQVLLDVAHRRLVDAEDLESTPFAGNQSCTAGLVEEILLDESILDLEEVMNWVPALSLIDWSGWNADSASVSGHSNRPITVGDGRAMLHGLVRPLFHCDRERNLELENGKRLFRADQNQLPKASLLRRLFNLLRFNSLDELILVLRDCYLALGHSIVMPPCKLEADGERIAAALLIPMSERDVAAGLRRWLQPTKTR